MADHTHIEWTDATWNPITGCSVLSPGCKDCYAMKLAGTRLKNHPSRVGLTVDTKAGPVWSGEVRFNEQWLDLPLRWTRPRRVFPCAHGDLFHENVPDAWIDRVFGVMALAHWHTFQVLTKRSARMQAYLSDPETPRRVWDAACEIMDTLPALAANGAAWGGEAPWPLRNVWAGVSVEDAGRAAERLIALLRAPAVVHWVSAEPLLSGIDFTDLCNGHVFYDALRGSWWHDVPDNHPLVGGKLPSKLDWVVVGGESGARPIRARWVRQIRDACARAGVPFFFKQWGDHLPEGQFDVDGFQWSPGYADPRVVWWDAKPGRGNPVPDDGCAIRIGKRQAGRNLDGAFHDGIPGR